MGILKKSVRLENLDKKIKRMTATIDSGADISAINPKIAKEMNFPVIWQENVQGIGGKRKKVNIVSGRLLMGRKRVSVNLAVMPLPKPEKLIIGHPELQYNQIILDFSKDKVRFKNKMKNVLRL